MSGSAINRNPGADLLRSGTLVRAPGEGEPPQPSVRQCTQSRQADRLRVQGFNATLRRVLVMVISIRGFVEACR